MRMKGKTFEENTDVNKKILIKVDVKTGEILVDRLDDFWRMSGVVSIPAYKVIEMRPKYGHESYAK